MAKIDLESRFYNICTKTNDNLSFHLFSLALILFASFVIGISVLPGDSFFSEHAYELKLFCSIYFIFEIMVRYFGHSVWDSRSIVGDKFSYTGIYIDAVIILISLLPYALISNLLVLRLFRFLAHPQITQYVPKISITNIAKIKFTTIRIIYIGSVLSVISFVYAVAGVNIFGAEFPEYWGDLVTAMFSLSGILLDGATINRYLMPLQEVYWWAWMYVCSYFIIGALIILNLVIAVIIDMLKERE